MNLPQARAWKKFRVVDVFDVANTHCVPKSLVEGCVGSTPYVTASVTDNSVARYVNFDEKYLDKGDVIVIGGKTFVVTYQERDFFSNDSHNLILRAKDIKGNHKHIYLFLVSVLENALGPLYNWGDSVSYAKIQKDVVWLPVNTTGHVDYEYMETWIAELERTQVDEVDAYLRATGLDDCELTVDEEKMLKELSSGTLQTSTFTAGDLFLVNGNPQLNKDSFEFSVDAEYPYFTRTVFNNGILGYVNYLDEGHKISGGSLAVGMLGMQFFYMGHDYYAGQFTKSIRLKAGGLNERMGLFFATLFNKAKGEFQKGLVRDFERLFSSLEIRLPVNDDGAVDFEKMENLVSACMKQTLKGVIEWIG